MSYLCNIHVYACKIMFILFLVFQARCRHRSDFGFATWSWYVDSWHTWCPPIGKINAFVKLFKEVPWNLPLIIQPFHLCVCTCVTMTIVPKEVLWDFLQPSSNEFIVLCVYMCFYVYGAYNAFNYTPIVVCISHHSFEELIKVTYVKSRNNVSQNYMLAKYFTSSSWYLLKMLKFIFTLCFLTNFEYD